MSIPNKLTVAMQDEVIKIAEKRLCRPLANDIKEKVCQNRWSYMGLEMMIDTVKDIEFDKIESYISNLDK
jgi:hypothetical protein